MITASLKKKVDKHKGFTLVEVLLVLVIVGMMALVVVLNLPESSRTPQATDMNQTFLLKFNHAKEQALLKNQLLGLEIKEQSYQFYIWAGKSWKSLDNPFFKVVEIEAPYQLDFIPGEFKLWLNEVGVDTGHLFMSGQQAEKSDSASQPKPQVIIFSSGEFTPFRLQWLSTNRVEPLIQLDASDGFYIQEVEDARW